MKAQHNYTTTVTTATWLRWGTVLLLTLAVLIVGLMMLWRTNVHSTLPTSTNDSFVRHVSGALTSCRACRDEWVAAQAVQPAVAVPAQRPQATGTTTVSRTTGTFASCRACRDEWIAAQAPIIPTGGVTFEQPEEYFHTPGPR